MVVKSQEFCFYETREDAYERSNPAVITVGGGRKVLGMLLSAGCRFVQNLMPHIMKRSRQREPSCHADYYDTVAVRKFGSCLSTSIRPAIHVFISLVFSMGATDTGKSA